MSRRRRKPSAEKKPHVRSGVQLRPSGDEGAADTTAPKPVLTSQGPNQPARIVDALRNIEGRRTILLLAAATLAMSSTIFPDLNFWPLAYVCLVPWLVCVCTAAKARFVYFVSYLLGLGFFLINIRWLSVTTLEGYLATAAYCAIYFPLTAWPIRHMYRRHGVSMALTAPIAWVAVEYLRSIGPLGFPWLLMGHSQYELLTVIQISDLVGAYGVSFVLVMINGWLTDLIIQPIQIWRSERTTRLPIGSLATLLILLGTLIYGSAQRSRRYMEPGPRVAMVQHDVPMLVGDGVVGKLTGEEALDGYVELARRAAAEGPDLIVLPETPIAGYINPEFLEADADDLQEILKRRYPPDRTLALLRYYQRLGRMVRDEFQQISTEFGIPIVLGSSSQEWKPTEIPPRVEAFNSAYLITPGVSTFAARYDKRHLVPFGEYVPFRSSYRPLYEWLNSLSPWGKNGRHYSLTPGDAYTVFEFAARSRDGLVCRAGTPICFEEIMPYICREFTLGDEQRPDRKNIDMLLCMSNDGWFMHSSELEQHLASGVFRAIENRVAVVRSVNTGASALIHPNGRIHSRVQLSDEQIAKLDPVVDTLEEIHELTIALGEQIEEPRAFAATRQQLILTQDRALQQALEAAGEEFTFLSIRLRRLRGNVVAGNSKLRAALDILRRQVEHDLATVNRWQTRPWTAPGYAVATALRDDRVTVYTRWGDWFAQGLVGLTCLMLLNWLWHRIRRRSGASAPQATEGHLT